MYTNYISPTDGSNLKIQDIASVSRANSHPLLQKILTFLHFSSSLVALRKVFTSIWI